MANWDYRADYNPSVDCATNRLENNATPHLLDPTGFCPLFAVPTVCLPSLVYIGQHPGEVAGFLSVEGLSPEYSFE